MTSPLDDISYKLGELSAGNAMLLARAEKRDAELQEVKKLLGHIDMKLDPIVEDLVWMKPQVRHYRSIRRRAAWVVSLLIGACSVTGGAVTTWFLKRYGA